jgi:hypothetical protein
VGAALKARAGDNAVTFNGTGFPFCDFASLASSSGI